MPWFIYDISGDRVWLLKPSDLPERPTNAAPANGDPFTPYYETEDHYDDEHVHLFAKSRSEALFKLNALLREKRRKDEASGR
jgi:hypothetical protein